SESLSRDSDLENGHPGGVAERSRWWSAATPPDPNAPPRIQPRRGRRRGRGVYGSPTPPGSNTEEALGSGGVAALHHRLPSAPPRGSSFVRLTSDCVTVAILAGGLGTRLRPVVPDRPKVLARVGHRPYLTFLLDRLVEASVRSVVLLTGYRADQVLRD